MPNGDTTKTGPESGKLNAPAFAQKLGKLIPKDIEAALKGEVLTAQADKAVHYITATIQMLSQLPRQKQKLWHEKILSFFPIFNLYLLIQTTKL